VVLAPFLDVGDWFFWHGHQYSEAVLAVRYRVTNSDGTMSGGPMYYLDKGLKAKWLAVLFALFASISAFGIGKCGAIQFGGRSDNRPFFFFR
jgi:Na+/alanine symporter